MLPAIISQCVIVLKDTALGAIVAFRELTAEARGIAQFVHASFVPLVVAALIYIAINYSLSRLAVFAERRLAQRGRGAAKPGGEEVEAAADVSGA
jgi:glutamate transport system permease protein